MATATVTWAHADGRALWNGQTLQEWSRVLVDDLAQAFDPLEIWLFGSVAQGSDNPNSDIDLLVVVEHLNPAELIKLKHRAVRATSVPAPADVTFSDPARMATRASVAGSIERAARHSGVLMFRRG